MAVYKPSNFSPNLQECDLNENNTFSCMINTSGEAIQAYKLNILSAKGDEVIYDPTTPTAKTVKNKQMLEIENVNHDTHDTGKLFENGKDYQWGVRVYNQLPNATTQPNTLVTEGYLVGSTKNVIWSNIPKDQTDALEPIEYDKYIEFTNIAPANMMKGAKDDPYPEIPTDNYTERQKIDWVTKEIGNDKDYIKIETVDPFTYNYVDGVEYSIYQCSDKHTVNSAFADPNSNINISNFIMIYDTLAKAQEARTAKDNPLTFVKAMSSCMDRVSGGGQAARKITGYSIDTGEIRLKDSFKSAPTNGQYYRIFSYDVVKNAYTTVDDAKNLKATLPSGKKYYEDMKFETEKGTTTKAMDCAYTSETTDYTINIDNNLYYVKKADLTNETEVGDPLTAHKIGGIAVTNSTYYKVVTNRWDATAHRLFVQPNINIKTDDTNPNEIVFTDGKRFDIVKHTDTVSGKLVDITFNKLDNTQWLLEGNNIQPSNGTDIPPIIPQTDYAVYTDFMDAMPMNIIYARTTPQLTINVKNAYEGEGEEIRDYAEIKPYNVIASRIGAQWYTDKTLTTRGEDEITENLGYETVNNYYSILIWPNKAIGAKAYLPEDYPNREDPTTPYHELTQEDVNSNVYRIEINKATEEGFAVIEIEGSNRYFDIPSCYIPTPYYDYRDISFKTDVVFANNNQQVKYYRYSLYAYNNTNGKLNQEPTLVTQSQDIYSTDIIWSFRGLQTGKTETNPNKYRIDVLIVDEYGKQFTTSADFGIYYVETDAIVPMEVSYDCHEKAIRVNAISPQYALSTDYTIEKEGEEITIPTVTDGDIIPYKDTYGDSGYLIIPENKILNYSTVDIAGYPPIEIPDSFSSLMQFRLRDDFIQHNFFDGEDIEERVSDEATVFVINHKIVDETSETPAQFETLTLKMTDVLGYYYDRSEQVYKENPEKALLKLYRQDENGEDILIPECFVYDNGEPQDYFDIPTICGKDYIAGKKLRYMLQDNTDGKNYITISDDNQIDQLRREGKLTPQYKYIFTMDYSRVFDIGPGVYNYSNGKMIPDTEILYIIVETSKQYPESAEFIAPENAKQEVVEDDDTYTEYYFNEDNNVWIDNAIATERPVIKAYNNLWLTAYLVVDYSLEENQRYRCYMSFKEGGKE